MHEDATTDSRSYRRSYRSNSSMSSAAAASPLDPELEPDPADTVELQVAFSSCSNSGEVLTTVLRTLLASRTMHATQRRRARRAQS